MILYISNFGPGKPCHPLIPSLWLFLFTPAWCTSCLGLHQNKHIPYTLNKVWMSFFFSICSEVSSVTFHFTFLSHCHSFHLHQTDRCKISALWCSRYFLSLFPCSLSTSSPPDSSPNYTSWPCSRAPSPLHIATRASKVGGEMDGSKGSCFQFSNTSPCRRAHSGSLVMSSAGMDASAQTGSHELTIPNDVSPLSAQ